MNTQILKAPALKLLKFCEDKGPTMLTLMGVGGVIGTAVEASRATIKAEKILKKEPNLTPIEKIQRVAPIYIPTLTLGTATIGCILGANYANLKKNAALAGMYAMANDKIKAIEQKDAEKKLSDAKVAMGPNQQNTIMKTKGGDTLCFDSISGRYFTSSMIEIQKAENEIMYRINCEECVSLNEFYFALGIDGIKYGDNVGWDRDTPIVIDYDASLCSDGTPCLKLDYKYPPKTMFVKMIGDCPPW